MDARMDPGDFWDSRLKMNAEEAVFYQWQQLEKTRCIDNFRIAAGLKDGFREGYFFADSDAYKWLEAASRILKRNPSAQLEALVDSFIDLLRKAQCDDGYLYTYNQILFGSSRWQNLQVEHEMYCLGHLIEAGVSHFEATGRGTLLVIARRAADLLLDTFMDASPNFTDGHEEIEIALIRLSRCTGINDYRELAKRFLQRRGRISFFPLRFTAHLLRSIGRMNTVTVLRRQFLKVHPEETPFTLPGHNQHVIPRMTPLRLAASALSGKFIQQHAPLGQQKEPVGHAVRFTYLNTASAMLVRDEKDDSDLPRLTKLWEHMVSRRMYVTGGIGALPLIEGFGRDFELEPRSAYAETCAALGSMLWTREMSLITGNPRYEDLYEWQLYNAASVGVGLDGRSYFYNNPLTCDIGLQRQDWYDIPCCPSNLSRAWASLQDHAVSTTEGAIIVRQYIPGTYELAQGEILSMSSSLPWSGNVALRFSLTGSKTLNLIFRIPAWVDDVELSVNKVECPAQVMGETQPMMESAVGLHFEDAQYVCLQRQFHDGDELNLTLGMPIRLRRQDDRVKGCGGMTALTRGPLVYCLERIDNAGDIFNACIDPGSLAYQYAPGTLSGTGMITGKSSTGETFTWIPYMLWGNRGKSKMTVFFTTP